LQQDLGQLKTQLQSEVEDDPLVSKKESQSETSIIENNYNNSREKRHNSKIQSTP